MDIWYFFGGTGWVKYKGKKYYIDEKYQKIDKIARYVGCTFGVIAILIPDFFDNGWYNFFCKTIHCRIWSGGKIFYITKGFCKLYYFRK